MDPVQGSRARHQIVYPGLQFQLDVLVPVEAHDRNVDFQQEVPAAVVREPQLAVLVPGLVDFVLEHVGAGVVGVDDAVDDRRDDRDRHAPPHDHFSTIGRESLQKTRSVIPGPGQVGVDGP